jgi:proline dehydrogenase
MKATSGILLRFARQWVAGEDVDSAIRRAKERNTVGMGVLINFLGEHLTDQKEIESTVSEYLRLLDLMDRTGVKGCASIKPSQLGIRLGREYWIKRAERILERSAQTQRFLWFDMENHTDTQETLDVYRQLKPSYPKLGICLQAYLKRTLDDVEKLRSVDGVIRLVKGAYNEPASIAYKDRDSVSRNFASILSNLFAERMQFAVGTHDESLVSRTISLNKEAHLPIEFQFLLGVRNDLKTQVLKEGLPVVEYIPYGTEWLAYSYRRIREKRSNLILLLRSFLSRG